ncbi:methionine--tRNA ligase [Candidatus Pacearchaeota archaeon]|nr:methionine--tRNA ligase [Candidatus Pacearchaeota archaeon]
MASKKFYITTAIDYVNAHPHIGHAYQKIAADVLARWHRIQGDKVFFLTGTDEHGQKIAKAAKEAGLSEKKFVDKISSEFIDAWKNLGISYNRFIRTTDKDHEEVAKKFVELMNKKGDIYKGTYEGLYCEGCEAFITEKELVNGRCRFHPNLEPKRLKEDTYYFRLSKYQDKLLKLYEKNKEFISPSKRRNEIINRVKEGLKDLSITRTSVTWGIPFPLEKGHSIYVWYEALLSYLAGIGWPNKKYEKFWPADVQLLGVDNSWFHCVILPAMLMSVGIEPPKKIYIHGFLTFNRQKISKSLGNVISPKYLVDKYGYDSVRYYAMRANPFGDDGDFSEQALKDRHNNELANKLGNLFSRITALGEKHGLEKGKNELLKKLDIKKIDKLFDSLEFDKVLNEIFAFIDLCNEYVQRKMLWEAENKKQIYEVLDSLKAIAILLYPFMPASCEKIAKHLGFKIAYNEIEKPLRERSVERAEALFKKI